MTSPIVTWLLTLISGAVGGNIGGAAIKDPKPRPGREYDSRTNRQSWREFITRSAWRTAIPRPDWQHRGVRSCRSTAANHHRHLDEQVCEGMMRAVSRVARSGNRIYVGQ
jgi:hypothetical protein